MPGGFLMHSGAVTVLALFAVHSGPGAAILIGTGAYLLRRWRQGRRARGLSAGAGTSAGTLLLAKRDA
jgi:hypothetical protein